MTSLVVVLADCPTILASGPAEHKQWWRASRSCAMGCGEKETERLAATNPRPLQTTLLSGRDWSYSGSPGARASSTAAASRGDQFVAQQPVLDLTGRSARYLRFQHEAHRARPLVSPHRGRARRAVSVLPQNVRRAAPPSALRRAACRSENRDRRVGFRQAASVDAHVVRRQPLPVSLPQVHCVAGESP